MEHTGDYYTCQSCEHIWDYNDYACPDCGSRSFEDVNVNYVMKAMEYSTAEYTAYLAEMLDSHGDLGEPLN